VEAETPLKKIPPDLLELQTPVAEAEVVDKISLESVMEVTVALGL
jgi:hypothetical protein